MADHASGLSRVDSPTTVGPSTSQTPKAASPAAEPEANVSMEQDAARAGLADHRTLSITIVGAGIAGLVCALALRKHGHRVTLLEKSAFSKHKETGAATFVGPNASGLLLRLGFDFEAAGANTCEGFLIMDGITGDVKNKQSVGWASEAFKREGVPGKIRPWTLCHRVDLHNELKRLALDPEGEGPVPELHLGITVQHVDTETAAVRLADGRVFSADFVIGADGSNSIMRSFVHSGTQLKPWGKSCYRWLIPRATLLSDDLTREFVQEDGYYAEASGLGKKIVIYPCRKNTMVNCAAFVPDEEVVQTASAEDWEHKAVKEGLLKSFETFQPETKRLLSFASEDVKVWKLMHVESPLESFVKGKVVLIGDAAHPFLPFLGQGAAQAMEDAVCIANIFQRSTTSTSGIDSNLTELLKLYDSIRRKRANYVATQTKRNGLQEHEGGPPPSFTLEMLNFCFKHDEWDNTDEKLATWQAKAHENGNLTALR